jgi:Transketolase, N-terminal subunit
MKLIVPFLQYSAYQMRRWSLKMTTQAGSGHATSSLSAADIVAVLFFHTMRFDPQDFNNPYNDRFILSKGHAVPVFYAAWHQLGMISDDELLTYRQFDSVLEGHPTLRFTYTEAATGSLGTGLSIGLGEALCATLDKRDYYTFVLMGDSEIAEGSIWEAAQLAAYYKAHNLIGIVDVNRLGQSSPTMQAIEGDEAARYAMMFGAFGWQTYTVDGHDVQALIEVFDKAKRSHDKPVMILAKTKKGYGVDFLKIKKIFMANLLLKNNCRAH